MKLRIAYQGVPGAYSHIAGKTVYPRPGIRFLSDF